MVSLTKKSEIIIVNTESDIHSTRTVHYMPEIGRFIQEDPYTGRLQDPMTMNSKYTYTHNNPTNSVDPSGKIALTTAIILIGALSGAVVNIKAVSDAGGSFEDILVSGLIGAASGAVTTWGGITFGFWGAVGFGALGGGFNSAANQLYYTGKVEDLSSVAHGAAFGGIIGGLSAYIFSPKASVFNKNWADALGFATSSTFSPLPDNGIPEDIPEDREMRECEQAGGTYLGAGKCQILRPPQLF